MSKVILKDFLKVVCVCMEKNKNKTRKLTTNCVSQDISQDAGKTFLSLLFLISLEYVPFNFVVALSFTIVHAAYVRIVLAI